MPRGKPKIPLGVTAVAELAQLVDAAQDPESGTIELRERLAEIELAMEDIGWYRLSYETSGELSRAGLARTIEICRMLYIKHPLINHAVNVQTNYVWGQGVAVTAKAASVNEVVQGWWDMRENKVELTGHRARMLKERELAVAGQNLFTLFTDAIKGVVRVRSINIAEVEEIITNPEDKRDPWFYHRRWTERTVTVGNSTPGVKTVEAMYPDWLHRPTGTGRLDNWNGIPIKWDAPVYHMKVGGLDNMQFGVPEVFAAIDWARAVQVDLEQYATTRKALARFAWTLTAKGGKATVDAAKAMLSSTVGALSYTGEKNPPPVTGSTLIQREGMGRMEPIRTAGMAPNPDEGRRLGLMVSAGTGIPETMLWGDATLGNYATAKSLDRPTELQMRARQQDWQDTFNDIIGYVIDTNALARKGILKGKSVPDRYSGEPRVVIMEGGKELDRRVDVEYPAILEHDQAATVKAIMDAATMNGKPFAGLVDPKTIARLLLIALHVNNVDEVLNQTHPDEPNPPALDPGNPNPPTGTGKVPTVPPQTPPPEPTEVPATPASTPSTT